MRPVFDLMRMGAVSLDALSAGRATAAAIAARQATRLAKLVQGAQAQSGFYRDHLKGVARGTPLAELPFVTRHALMAHFDDWVTDPQLHRSELEALTADSTRVAEPWLGRYVVWESSGTSGQPGIFVQDAQAMAVCDALEALRRSSPRPLHRWSDPLYLTERIAFIGATGGHFASYVSIERLRQINPWVGQAVRSFSIMQPATDLMAALNDFMPTVIATYPTVAAMLAKEAERGVLRIAPAEVWTGGETLGRVARRSIEQALGCTVRNSYGASEFLTIGWECSHGHMHANTDWVILEPVDEHHRPMPPGEMSCSTLLTNLANHVQPLIRYDIGDQIAVSPLLCVCGSPLPVIEVQGRRDDPLVMADPHGRQVTLLPMALTTLIEEEAGVFDFQLRRRDDHTLVLRLPLTGDEADRAVDRCRRALAGFAATQGLPSLRIIAEVGRSATRGRSGKARRIIATAH